MGDRLLRLTVGSPSTSLLSLLILPGLLDHWLYSRREEALQRVRRSCGGCNRRRPSMRRNNCIEIDTLEYSRTKLRLHVLPIGEYVQCEAGLVGVPSRDQSCLEFGKQPGSDPLNNTDIRKGEGGFQRRSKGMSVEIRALLNGCCCVGGWWLLLDGRHPLDRLRQPCQCILQVWLRRTAGPTWRCIHLLIIVTYDVYDFVFR